MKFNLSNGWFGPILPLLLVAFLAVGCSNDEPEGAVGTDRMEEGTIGADGEPVGEDGENNGAGVRSGEGESRVNNAGNGAGGSGVDREMTAKIEAARAEKKRNSDELNGLRSRLTAELDQVRARLNDGSTQGEQRDKDQARAATLAQGLERLDRALQEIEASADASWEEIKENSNKEVDEMRAWMKENDVKGAS